MYQNFIGIDIGKASFFVAIHGQESVQEFPNTVSGFQQLIRDYSDQLNDSLIVLETTGGYEMALVRFLQNQGIKVHRANTRKVKHFIRSLGQLGKSDTIDAKGLARYGYERHETLALFKESEHKALLQLVCRRQELKQMLVQEKNRFASPDSSAITPSFKRLIRALEKELQVIEGKVEAIFAADSRLMECRDVLKTIEGVGDITAMELIAMMPELGQVDRKQIASLAGVAPHPNESGNTVGHRYTRGGRKAVKPVLFMAAMSAARSKGRLGDDYRAFVARGKKKMVAMTAIMRKIMVIANARVRDYYDGIPLDDIVRT